ncbi:Opacity protein [Rhizobium sp. RU20A]|uniref:outer membrane protein n=1 Tax=Rhizobium sp. RU20A TaxID=1907412 RepID=UPI000955B3AF|nr:outer membrane beta-barrel protein [Rhizobium sp. RU20A]SIQ37496.1 Opacity protein [Rhizobium sp. RU20A]
MRLIATLAATTALGLATLTVGAAARAEEQDPPEVQIDAPEVTITGSTPTSGVYLRGDLGYTGWTGEGDPTLRTAIGGQVLTTPFDSERFGHARSGGVGIGVQFTDTFRADLTAERFTSDFAGHASVASPCAGQAASTACAQSFKGDVTGTSVMANAYVDLATLAGVTPYLGAGLGVTRLDFGGFSASSACVAGSVACAAPLGSSETLSGIDSWRFSYALMAGLSYDITDRVKLDLGYRFQQITSGDTFRFGASEPAGGNGAKSSDDGFGRHEFRAGVRVSLW